jgi:hypothetical protein
MAKLLSNQHAEELPRIFEAVRNMDLPTRGRPIRRDRGIGGGGGSRSYVVITAVTDAANYVGNVITSPDDSTVIDTGVAIKVNGATANSFEVGYENFADNVDDVYYLDGSLLG